MRMMSKTGIVAAVCLCLGALPSWPAAGQAVASGEAQPQRFASVASLQVTDGDGLTFGSLSPDGRLMITTGLDKKICVWDMGTGQLLRSDGYDGGTAICGALSADGKLLATGTYGDTVHFWDVTAGKRVGKLVTGERKSLSVDFSPDQTRLAVASEGGTVAVWNVKPQQKVWTSAKQSRPVAVVVFSPDGKTLATTTYDRKNAEEPGEVKLWDAQNGSELAVLSADALGHTHARFSPDGKLLAAGGAERELRIWEVESRELRWTISTPRSTSCLAFMPDGKRILTGHSRAPLTLWDIDSGGRVAEYTDAPQRSSTSGLSVQQVACSGDGSLIAATGAKGEVVFWPTQPDESTAGETSAKRLLGWSEDKPSAHVVFSRMLRTMREADTLYYESDYRCEYYKSDSRSEIEGQAQLRSDCTYKLWAKKPNFARIEAASADGEKKGVLVTNGKRFWVHWPTGRPPFSEPFGRFRPGHGKDRHTSYMQWPAPRGTHYIGGQQMQFLGFNLSSSVVTPSLVHGMKFPGTLDAVRSLGTEKVGEEECDVIETSHFLQQFIRRLWVSRKDHLPRKLKQTSRRLGSNQTTVKDEVWSNVRINEEMPSDQFHWRPPKGWTKWSPGGSGSMGKASPTGHSR